MLSRKNESLKAWVIYNENAFKMPVTNISFLTCFFLEL